MINKDIIERISVLSDKDRFLGRKLCHLSWGQLGVHLESILKGLEAKVFEEKVFEEKVGVFVHEKLIRKEGIRLLTPFCRLYPYSFFELENPPLVISYLGKFEQSKQMFSVVGTREPQTYTVEWMQYVLRSYLRKGQGKGARGQVVVSGGARGVDQISHRIGFSENLPCIIFLPSGLLNAYPKMWQKKIGSLVKEGFCFVSEYLPHQGMYKSHFHRRNELIAAISDCVLIIEAKVKSGTMVTAKKAIELHRPLGVVPGHPLVKSYEGSLGLIYEGAQMIRDEEDLRVFSNSAMAKLRDHDR